MSPCSSLGWASFYRVVFAAFDPAGIDAAPVREFAQRADELALADPELRAAGADTVVYA